MWSVIWIMAIRIYVKCYLFSTVCYIMFFFPLGFICPQWQLNNKISPRERQIKSVRLINIFHLLQSYNIEELQFIRLLRQAGLLKTPIKIFDLHARAASGTDIYHGQIPIWLFCLHQDYAFPTDNWQENKEL